MGVRGGIGWRAVRVITLLVELTIALGCLLLASVLALLELAGWPQGNAARASLADTGTTAWTVAAWCALCVVVFVLVERLRSRTGPLGPVARPLVGAGMVLGLVCMLVALGFAAEYGVTDILGPPEGFVAITGIAIAVGLLQIPNAWSRLRSKELARDDTPGTGG